MKRRCRFLLDKLIKLIRRIFGNPEPKMNFDYDDIDLDKEIKQRQNRFEKFDSIVGDTPLKQIDWIIENGFSKFHDTYENIMSGKYEEDEEKPRKHLAESTKIEIDKYELHLDHKDNKDHYHGERVEVRGGIGNVVLQHMYITRMNRSGKYE